MKENFFVLGVDIGGTKVSCGMMDSLGNLVHFETFKTQKSDPNLVVEAILSIVHQLSRENKKIKAIGIGMAGQIETATGKIYFSPNLGWKDVEFGALLEKKINIPVIIINDVQAATRGEWHYGAGKNEDDFISIFVGTGIGGGIVSQGKMLVGHSHTAGEIGHITIDLHGDICTCGNRGCFETLASGWGIAYQAKKLLNSKLYKSDILLMLVNGITEDITAIHVFKAYEEKDPLALKIIDEATKAWVAGVLSVVHTLNPAKIILGGGVIEGNEWLVNIIRDGVLNKSLKAASKDLKIVKSHLGQRAVVMGAADYALNQEKTVQNNKVM